MCHLLLLLLLLSSSYYYTYYYDYYCYYSPPATEAAITTASDTTRRAATTATTNTNSPTLSPPLELPTTTIHILSFSIARSRQKPANCKVEARRLLSFGFEFGVST